MIGTILDKLYFFYCVLAGKHIKYFTDKGLTVGKNCRIYTRYFGSEPYLITIGDNCTVASNTSFVTHDGSTWLVKDAKGRRFRYEAINIGSNVFIGVNCIIMPGVKIEDNVIVAAGSVVTKSVPSGTVVGGVPAKVIGSFNEIAKRMLESYTSESDFKKLSGTKREKITRLANYTPKPYM